MVCPFNWLIALVASSGVFISTKPNPLERPVSRSVMTAASTTPPACSKRVRRSLSVTVYGRLPTYNFLFIDHAPRIKTESSGVRSVGWVASGRGTGDISPQKGGPELEPLHSVKSGCYY